MVADFGGRIHVFWNTLDSKACPREQGGASTAALESDNREVANAARTVTSTINNKEDQGDNNESTDTASSGIGLP